MIKPARAEAKFTPLCLCSARRANRDVRPSVCFCGWVSFSKIWLREKDRGKTRALLLSSCLLASIPCFCDHFCQVRYAARSLLLFGLLKGDKIWNSQLRASRKAGGDVITGLCRIGSKGPNNKVTSFPGNNRNSPSCCQRRIPAFMYDSVKRKGTPEKELEFSQSTRCSNVSVFEICLFQNQTIFILDVNSFLYLVFFFWFKKT